MKSIFRQIRVQCKHCERERKGNQQCGSLTLSFPWPCVRQSLWSAWTVYVILPASIFSSNGASITIRPAERHWSVAFDCQKRSLWDWICHGFCVINCIYLNTSYANFFHSSIHTHRKLSSYFLIYTFKKGNPLSVSTLYRHFSMFNNSLTDGIYIKYMGFRAI